MICCLWANFRLGLSHVIFNYIYFQFPSNVQVEVSHQQTSSARDFKILIQTLSCQYWLRLQKRATGLRTTCWSTTVELSGDSSVSWIFDELAEASETHMPNCQPRHPLIASGSFAQQSFSWPTACYSYQIFVDKPVFKLLVAKFSLKWTVCVIDVKEANNSNSFNPVYLQSWFIYSLRFIRIKSLESRCLRGYRLNRSKFHESKTHQEWLVVYKDLCKLSPLRLLVFWKYSFWYWARRHIPKVWQTLIIIVICKHTRNSGYR